MENATTSFFAKFVADVPVLGKDPFVNMAFDHPPPPEVGYELWRYWLTILVGAPVNYFIIASFMSWASGEWARAPAAIFRHSMKMTLTTLLITSLPLAWMFKQTLEGAYTKIIYDFDECPVWYHCMSPLLFMLAADFWFYWSHRLFHEVEFLYTHSHSLHHTNRPTVSYAGHAADWFEVTTQGYANALFPAFVFPMHVKVFLVMLIVDQVWSIYLHNFEQYIIPSPYVLDCSDHNVHHFYGQQNFNFGLYSTFWDKIMGTYKPIAEITSKSYLRKKHHAAFHAFRAETSKKAN